jgi:uncharacterized membrane-anchored protein
MPLNYEIDTAVAVPVVAILAWLGVRRVRKVIGREAQAEE